MAWAVAASALVTVPVLGLAVVGSPASVGAKAEQWPAIPPPGPDDPAASPTPGAHSAAPAVAPQRSTSGPQTRAITVAFGGDVHGEKQIRRALEAGEQPLAGMAPVLAAADLAIVNLETALGDGGLPADKRHTFLAPHTLLVALREAGVDVVSLANNHSLDYGWTTLRGGLARLADAGLATVGVGEDAASAYAPHVVEVLGARVAVIGLTRVIPRRNWAAGEDRPGLASGYDLRRAAAAVRAGAAAADHVIVTVHWGTELAGCPDGNQLTLARVLHEAGADVVVGHHPHVLQGVDHGPHGLTAYSLGNLLWYSTGPVTRLSGVLTVTLGPEGVEGWQLHPAVVTPSGSPLPAGDDDGKRALERLELLPGHPTCLHQAPSQPGPPAFVIRDGVGGPLSGEQDLQPPLPKP
ncbi:MAG: CapA family protein [Nitriliruptorales bacterium]